MAIKLSVKRNKTVDAINAYTVTVTSDEPAFGCKLEYEVHISLTPAISHARRSGDTF